MPEKKTPVSISGWPSCTPPVLSLMCAPARLIRRRRPQPVNAAAAAALQRAATATALE
jgi:hypothetical protein